MADGVVPTSTPEVIEPDAVEPPDGPHALVDGPDRSGAPNADGADDGVPDVSSPAKIIRIGAMVKQLLEEVRATTLDEASRGQLRDIYQRSVDQLQSALSPELAAELEELSFDFPAGRVPTDVELRMAQAQLVGWLEGLFHGIQAALMAQQMSARQQLEGMRAQLMPGAGAPGQGPQGPVPGPGYI